MVGKSRKTKSKNLISILLAVAMIFGVFAAATLPAAAANEPFQVVEHPVGAVYTLNEPAIPIRATFTYNPQAGFGYIDSDSPIKVKWYWSANNSNVDRINGLGESDVAYNRIVSHTTTHIPATDAVGVKYYYAVITYSEKIYTDSGQSEIEPRETVTNPARIEVVTTKPPEREFDVLKTDEDGNPLNGAVLALVPDSRHEQDPYVTAREETTANGKATFSASSGYYVLGEKRAPDGYIASDEKYYIWITPNGVYIYDPETKEYVPYEKPVIFINKKSPPSSQAPSPLRTPSPSPSTITTPTPAANNERSLDVKKTDADGKPLSGAVLTLIPDAAYAPQGASVKAHEKTTADGKATFSAAPGYYILGERQAPAGYNATDDKYYIHITSGGVLLYDPVTKTTKPYKEVTFVNKKIPALNKDDHFAYMQGYPEGDFRPEKNMTRAEAVVMFSRLLSESMDLTADYRYECYPDLDVGNPSMLIPWYVNQVCYMHNLGVLADYSRDGRFRPDESVTRAEFATLAAHFDDLALTDVNKFTDVAADHWAIKYINSAGAKGWITGYPDGTFKPEALITRAEVVTLVNRMLDRAADKAYLTINAATLPRQYWDFTADHWARLMIMEASLGHDYVREGAAERWTTVYK